MLYMAVWH